MDWDVASPCCATKSWQTSRYCVKVCHLPEPSVSWSSYWHSISGYLCRCLLECDIPKKKTTTHIPQYYNIFQLYYLMPWVTNVVGFSTGKLWIYQCKLGVQEVMMYATFQGSLQSSKTSINKAWEKEDTDPPSYEIPPQSYDISPHLSTPHTTDI